MNKFLRVAATYLSLVTFASSALAGPMGPATGITVKAGAPRSNEREGTVDYPVVFTNTGSKPTVTPAPGEYRAAGQPRPRIRAVACEEYLWDVDATNPQGGTLKYTVAPIPAPLPADLASATALGFGLSDKATDRDLRPEAHARRLRALVEALDLRDVTLVVHDFGGPIGLPLALSADARVARVVVTNSWMWSSASDPLVTRIDRFVRSALGRFAHLWLNRSRKHDA